MGRTQKDIYVVESMDCVTSIDAQCSANDDEIAIRKEINSSDLGFDVLDEVIDRIRLADLVTYPLYHTVYGLKENGITGARPL